MTLQLGMVVLDVTGDDAEVDEMWIKLTSAGYHGRISSDPNADPQPEK